MKNTRVRFAMLETKTTQKELAEMYGVGQPTISEILNKFELAKKEQDGIVKALRAKGE